MAKRPVRHRVRVKKRNLYGSRMWWAVCSCRTWFQGCHEKQEAKRLADLHLSRMLEESKGAQPLE